jgi:hypothetical protein
MPNDDPQLRASDDDRDRTASLLREHHAAGRLNVDEFQERLDATYEAKTLGQLQHLLADLPSIDLYHLPEQSMRRSQQVAASPPVPAEHHGRLSAAWRHHWASWASVSLLLFVIWAVGSLTSGHMNGFWFLWVAGPWGAILLSRWLFGQPPGSGHGPGRTQGAGHGLEERSQRLDDHMRRHQDRMQEHQERHQERLRRRQRRE